SALPVPSHRFSVDSHRVQVAVPQHGRYRREIHGLDEPELGRIAETLFLLAYTDDEAYLRRILVHPNRGEGLHRLPVPSSTASVVNCGSTIGRGRKTSLGRWV